MLAHPVRRDTFPDFDDCPGELVPHHQRRFSEFVLPKK
jgi:hypothetical protein